MQNPSLENSSLWEEVQNHSVFVSELITLVTTYGLWVERFWVVREDVGSVPIYRHFGAPYIAFFIDILVASSAHREGRSSIGWVSGVGGDGGDLWIISLSCNS